jgi:hypothetical protein
MNRNWNKEPELKQGTGTETRNNWNNEQELKQGTGT